MSGRKPRCHWRARIEFLVPPAGVTSPYRWNQKRLRFINWRGSVVNSKNVFHLEKELQLVQQQVEYERGIPCRISREYRYSKYYNPETQKPRAFEELVNLSQHTIKRLSRG